MELARRSFFRALGGGAAGAVVLHAAPEVSTREVDRMAHRAPVFPEPEHALAGIEESFARVAQRAATWLDTLVALPRCNYIHDGLAQRGDTINVPIDGVRFGRSDLMPLAFFAGDRQPCVNHKFQHHPESTMCVVDGLRLLRDKEYADIYLQAACIGIASALAKHCDGRRLLSWARLPLPLPGTGVFAAYGQTDRVLCRALLYYSPVDLGQLLTVDALYGVA